MDLLPTPDQVVSAAGNLAHQLVHGGLADLRPMPRTLLEEGERRRLHHYPVSDATAPQGDPVLLVAPLAAPALCYDLRRGCSLVEHLVAQGRPTYLVEYGEVDVHDRELGIGPWVDEVVPRAIEQASAHAGGRPVHVVGWSLGGIFALLAAADRPDLPIASVVAAGSPTDVSQVPMVAPPRPLLDPGDAPGLLGQAYRAVGGAPAPLAWAWELPVVQDLVARPLAIAVHLDDADYLAQVEAVGRFARGVSAYPGRSYGRLYHRFVPSNALVDGSMELGDRTISLTELTCPVLVLAGTTDGIAPVGAVRAVLPHLSGSREPRFEIVPGGHLGLLTGRAARTGSWAVLDEWVDEWSGPEPPTRKTTKKTATKPRRKAAGTETIGSNPSRRYGSGGSRALTP